MTDMNLMELADEEFAEGYSDASDPGAPRPSGNRSEAYRHSFEVRRAEMAGTPIPAQLSRERAASIALRARAQVQP